MVKKPPANKGDVGSIPGLGSLKSPVTVDSSVQIKGKAKCILLSINVPDKSVLKGKNEIISM